MDEIIKKIEAAGFQWAVCKEANGIYTAYVTESRDVYIADTLSSSFGCEEAHTATDALTAAFTQEVKYRDMRNAVGQQARKP